jgi:predicted nucleotide-binding protein
MVKKGAAPKSKAVSGAGDERKYRNFPKHSLEAALVLSQKIQDEMGGQPMNRLLLADALGLSPSSSNYRDLLSSAFKYKLTDGTEKAASIGLTSTGADATQHQDQARRLVALRSAVMHPDVFARFFTDYANKKVPSSEMLPKILRAQYSVPPELAEECASLLLANGRFVSLIRDIGGSPHVLPSADPVVPAEIPLGSDVAPVEVGVPAASELPARPASAPAIASPASSPATGSFKPIFVGHGKNKTPLQQLQKLLTTFQIPHKVVVDEPNLGRPISQKVKETIEECGSAILIFTRDERLFDSDQKEVWRPSENVIHELGATSFVYGDRIVIFKEKGLQFPTNFQNIGYIEFESDDLQARTADLLKELIGFGLVRVTPT